MNYQYQEPYASQPGDGYSPFGGAGVNSASGFGGLGGNPGVPGTLARNQRNGGGKSKKTATPGFLLA